MELYLDILLIIVLFVSIVSAGLFITGSITETIVILIAAGLLTYIV